MESEVGYNDRMIDAYEAYPFSFSIFHISTHSQNEQLVKNIVASQRRINELLELRDRCLNASQLRTDGARLAQLVRIQEKIITEITTAFQQAQ